jgi:hypothetical protein
MRNQTPMDISIPTMVTAWLKAADPLSLSRSRWTVSEDPRRQAFSRAPCGIR